MHKVANNNGPRTWSSYTNITTKDDRKDFKMNSIENILEYRNLNSTYYSPPLLRKTAATTYDFPEQPAKKDKKWSLGSLFRRKKKEESDSSTDEEADRKGFLNRRKRKSEKKKKIKQRATFDHVIIPATGAPLYNSYNNHDENGILSDPTGGFASYTGRVLARTPNHNRRNNQQLLGSKELVNNVNASRSSLGSADSLCKNTRRVQVKIRAEARRETNICVSSSDEDSQRSASSSRIRSDESINKVHEVTANKKSRAARTERYIRRISKDEELPPGLRLSKSDADNNINRLVISDEKKEVKSSSSRSPMLQNNAKLRVTSQNSGVSTIPPSHSSQKKNNLDNLNAKIHKPPPILTYNPNRYSSLTSTESKDSYPNYQRSISYDADIHKSTSPDAQNEVIHAQLPLGKPSHRYRNLSLVEQPSNPYKHPPPPPPRDPWRIGTTVQHAEHARPMSYCFERNQRTYPTNDLIDNKNSPKSQSFNWRSSVRSTSEDHLPLESSPIPFHPRPSSATADHPNQTFYRQNQESSANTTADQYQYMADKNPRSRKPIFIQSFKEDKKNESPNALEFWKNKKNKQEKSEGVKQPSEAQKALDFWKQKEEEGKQMEKKSPLPPSPQIFTASTHVRTNIFLPSVLKSDMETNEDYKGSSPFKPISPQVLPTDDQENAKTQPENGKSTSPAAIERKSSNLEDALDELEAIYNSLRLGDEDLLERAEERERSIAAKKIMELNSEVYPEGWGAGIPRGAVSDSSFSYEPFEAVESPKRKRQLKKYRNSDRKNDDMAVRKLNKERSSTISDPKEVISKVSYLLASPLHGISDDINVNPGRNHKEPDITYDDMVFRTVKHSNNTLKVSDPQPPFGIPVGPILPACNSDYLHATPDDTPQYTAKNKRIPDIVKDDLAYRNLRKDNGKDPVLPPPMSDDYLNNNNPHAGVPKLTYNNSLKKKRAVRSLSANIYNLIQTEPFIIPISEKKPPEQPKEKSSLNDIADAMEIARQILKEKEEKISATRKAFLSDTETKYKKFETGNSYLAECRMNFLNNMKSKDNDKDQRNEGKRMEHYVTSKPPRGITPEKKSSKESSLSPGDTMKVLSFEKKDQPTLVANNLLLVNNSLVETSVNLPAETTTATAKTELSSPPSDLSNNCLQKSSLEDLLTAFAVEAQEASRRIADELKQLEKNIHFNRNVSATPQSAAVEEIKSFDETNREEVEEVNIEPLVITQIETVVAEETEGMTSHPVSVANVVQTTCEVAPIDDKPVITEIHSDSEHDYVNMGSDAEIEKAIPLIDESVNDSPGCKSPYEEKKADLIAGFQEIKKVASDPELLQTPMSKLDANCDERDNDGDQSGGGEKCVLKCDNALTFAENTKECAFLTRAFINVSENGSIITPGCDIDNEHSETVGKGETRYETKLFIDRHPTTISECDISGRLCRRLSLSGSPHSSGFHSNSASDAEPNDNDISSDCFKIQPLSAENAVSVLKSPKLVLNLESRHPTCAIRDQNVSTDSAHDVSSASSSLDSSKFDDNSNLKPNKDCIALKNSDDNEISNDRRHTLNENPDSSAFWCIDPLVLAFACSYGVACTYQFVTADIVTILGLLFVFISFIAALIL